MNDVLHLFEGVGIELEYMLVDAQTLAVAPVCDRVLEAQAGEPTCDLETGTIGWSNELALHVLELKTAGPADAVSDAVAEAFSTDIRRIDALAAEFGARVMGSAMHPTMDPQRESVLWPHDGRDIYATYDAVFGCEGHGWTNLQSCHLNLPFGDDDEFGQLHAAIRVVLPLLPALAASSPYVEGVFDGVLDRRLAVYARNQRRVPSIIGAVVPEPVFTRAAYEQEILAPMYADIAPLDPGGVLAHEWLNSRGAIARFERDAIEIRVLDVQESPWVDLALARLVVATVQALVRGRWVDPASLRTVATAGLREVFDQTVHHAEAAVIDNPQLLRALGRPEGSMTAGALWKGVYGDLERDGLGDGSKLDALLRRHLDAGTLATRIRAAVGPSASPQGILEVYRAVAACAGTDALFLP